MTWARWYLVAWVAGSTFLTTVALLSGKERTEPWTGVTWARTNGIVLALKVVGVFALIQVLS